MWAVSVGLNMNVFRIELEKTRRAFKAASTCFEKCELRNKHGAVWNHEDDLGLSHITAVQPQKGATGKSHWILRSLSSTPRSLYTSLFLTLPDAQPFCALLQMLQLHQLELCCNRLAACRQQGHPYFLTRWPMQTHYFPWLNESIKQLRNEPKSSSIPKVSWTGALF